MSEPLAGVPTLLVVVKNPVLLPETFTESAGKLLTTVWALFPKGVVVILLSCKFVLFDTTSISAV